MRVTRQLATMVGISVGVLVLAAVPVEIPLKLALVGTFLLGFGLAGWYGILRPTERALVRVRHT